MRYLIISDLHANWEALEAVLGAAEDSYDRIVCCGDLIGYGADPNRVVSWVREHVFGVVRGNHDKAGVNLNELEWFNPVAQAATIWTHHELSPENMEYVKNLAAGPLVLDTFAVVHGSPLNEDEYIVNPSEAAEAFGYLPAPLVFFGHTHVQGGFEWSRRKAGKIHPAYNPSVLELSGESAYLINPGSVGQPRDENPEAAYALFDDAERIVVYHRTPYDVEQTQRKIREAGLPSLLADRLSLGR